jgi:glycosyltransferase involved in cell wall biosynthesis
MEHEIIRNRNIVLFSFMPWNGKIASNFKEMAYEMAKHNRVLFIDRAPDRISSLRNKSENTNAKTGIEQINENLWVYYPSTVVESINWIPVNFIYDIFSKRNTKRLAEEIKPVIDQLHFDNAILINDNDFFRGIGLKQLLGCSEYIFYIRDYLTYQPYFRKHGPRMEKKLFDDVDLVVANSTYLANYGKKFHKESYDIGQGCELDSYLATGLPVPEDLKQIPKPIVGYTGAISGTRLDKEIIGHIAEKMPDVSVVLVGPLTDAFDQEALKNHKNVHFLGSKPPSAIPGYVYHFDVCMNPQQVNQMTVGNYPRKADEYLAMGKAMVATETEAMQMFSDYVFLCRTKDDYVNSIRKILSQPSMQNGEEKIRRKQFAMSHTWEESIGKLGDAFHQYQKNKQ